MPPSGRDWIQSRVLAARPRLFLAAMAERM